MTQSSAVDWRKRAVQIVEERGWCQHGYTAPDGAVCLAGAVFVAFGVDPESDYWPDSAVDALAEVADLIDPELSECYTEPVELIGFWNDQPVRTKDEVIALLRGDDPS